MSVLYNKSESYILDILDKLFNKLRLILPVYLDNLIGSEDSFFSADCSSGMSASRFFGLGVSLLVGSLPGLLDRIEVQRLVYDF